MSKFLYLLLFLIGINLNVIAQPKNNTAKLPSLKNDKNNWVDSVYKSLSLEQKLGQLFMVAAYSGGEKYNQELIEQLITQNQIGGLIFMQGTPLAQAEQTNKYQGMSNVPLLIAMDAEWGLGMRLKEVKNLPKQLMMGAMKDSTMVYKVAQAIALQCKRLGVHIDFAPVVDVNNNPENPVINFRSFGENKYKVANYGIQYMRGLQDNGIMACAKHFPGHGDVSVDSHKDLPIINKSITQLENLELYPFDALIRNGIQSIMVAHLQVPALDNRTNMPTTLSSKTITDLLKNKMKFQGLIFTDALNMQGVAKYYQPGEVDVKAFEAGNDVLLFSQDVPKAIAKLKEALQKKVINEKRVEESVRKILQAKYDADLHHFLEIDEVNLEEDLNKQVSKLRTEVAEKALTLLSDEAKIIDKISKVTNGNICYVGIGTQTENDFTIALKSQGIKDVYFAPTRLNDITSFANKCKNYTAVIVGIHNSTGYPAKNFNIDSVQIAVAKALSKNNNTIITLLGNPYAAKNFSNMGSLLVAYDETPETQEVAARLLFKRILPQGTTPVKINNEFVYGRGITTYNSTNTLTDSSRFVSKQGNTDNDIARILQYATPQEVGANISELQKLDSYFQSAISQGVFPGCSFMAVKKGQVFYNKSFGYTTYDKYTKIDNNTLYDIASCTKVCATTMAVMKLYDQGKLDLNATLGKYLPLVKGTDKEYLKIKDVLLHQAGLKAWIPFYKETLDSTGYPKNEIYQRSSTGNYNIKVSNNLYMQKHWQDTMWKRILYSPLENRGKYEYSDLDFLILQKVVEHISGKSLDVYVNDEFYKPLGLKSICYLPKKNNAAKVCAPSEIDNYFRHQIVQGYVHDMGAAMFGGVCGHAGLFSTTNDIAVLFQLLLNGGEYNGKRYLKQSTVSLFSSKNSFISQRGLGFDRQEKDKGKAKADYDISSNQTFGHTGFTGTCVWADKTNDIIIVFLSNRTYPSADNWAIRNKRIRENAQKYIYNSLGIYTKK
jgi:beta-glucosidase-like glycosyl hydrolase/CubicO group peptidase (beta-lactamase class C family)